MTNKKYKHLLFDLDRTLWDFETNAELTLKEIYNCFGINKYCKDFGLFLEKYKSINEQLWREYREQKITKDQLSKQRFYDTFVSFGLDDKVVGEEAGEMYLEKSAEKTTLFEGAKETLEILKNDYQIHIITNGFKKVQTKKLKNCGLSTYIDKLITSEDAGWQKPDKRIFKHTLESIHASNQECVMIGDDEKTDIKGACEAEIDSIWFNPHNRKPVLDIVKEEVGTLKDLLTIL